MKFKLVQITIITILTILSCTPNYPPVNNKSKVIKLGNTDFTMKEVPGAKANTMKLASWDDGNEEDIKPFWMAETELTSEVWTEVYIWATGDKNLNNIIDKDETQGMYTFANSGKVDNFKAHQFDVESTFDPSDVKNKNKPISFISWNDAIIFCNAITEYYNYSNPKNKLSTVYNINGKIIRNSREINNKILNSIVPDNSATGFRLPTEDEWLCAASYINGRIWNHARSVSGDYSGRVDSDNKFSEPGVREIRWLFGEKFVKYSKKYGDYAWYKLNSDSGNGPEVHNVALKSSNALGIYDMSGNVDEYIWTRLKVYTEDIIDRYYIGKSFLNEPSELYIDNKYPYNPSLISRDGGVRLVVSF